MSMPLILKSTGSAFVLPDIGVIIGSEGNGGSDFSGIPELIRALGQSSNLRARVIAGTVKVNNGSVDLSALAGQQYLNQMWIQAGNDIAVQMGQVEGIISDYQHGARAGGTTHPVATTSVDGYMSAADKTRLGTIKGIKQTLQSVLAVDTQTNSVLPNYVDFLTVNITTTGGSLLIVATPSGESSNANAITYYAIDVDGTMYSRFGVRSPGGGAPQGGTASRLVTGLSAAAHVVRLRWCVSAATSSILPVTKPESERAGLIVQELE